MTKPKKVFNRPDSTWEKKLSERLTSMFGLAQDQADGYEVLTHFLEENKAGLQDIDDDVAEFQRLQKEMAAIADRIRRKVQSLDQKTQKAIDQGSGGIEVGEQLVTEVANALTLYMAAPLFKSVDHEALTAHLDVMDDQAIIRTLNNSPELKARLMELIGNEQTKLS